MFEKRLVEVLPKVFTADGTADGKVTLADTHGFKVKQQVVLTSATSKTRLEVKRVESKTILYVGPIGTHIKDRTDISAFTVVDAATIEAPEQVRPNVPEQEIERLTYEEEPTVARRVTLVDEYGNLITGDNPLPVDAVLNIGSLDLDLDAKNGDNVAISAHPFQIFSDGAGTLTTPGYQEIFTYTSVNALTKISYVGVSISTTANVVLKINGVIKREYRTSPADRNAHFQFYEHRSLPLGAVLTIEAEAERFILSSYNTFTFLEGYIA